MIMPVGKVCNGVCSAVAGHNKGRLVVRRTVAGLRPVQHHIHARGFDTQADKQGLRL
jgi:hypothetical protein